MPLGFFWILGVEFPSHMISSAALPQVVLLETNLRNSEAFLFPTDCSSSTSIVLQSLKRFIVYSLIKALLANTEGLTSSWFEEPTLDCSYYSVHLTCLIHHTLVCDFLGPPTCEGSVQYCIVSILYGLGIHRPLCTSTGYCGASNTLF